MNEEKEILTNEEIQRFLDMRYLRPEGSMSIIAWWKFWIDKGIEEFSKLDFTNKIPWANCTDDVKKKIGAIERVLATSGDIKNNPKSIRCPYCGSKYVRIIEYGYLSHSPIGQKKDVKDSRPLSCNNGCLIEPENRQCLACGTVYIDK